MGCDIHMSVCIRNPKTNKFVPLAMTDYDYRNTVVEPYTGRYYQLFGVLANVRCGKLVEIGFYPKDRFDINQIEWPFLEHNKKITSADQARELIEMLRDYQYDDNDKPKLPFTPENVCMAMDVYGFRNTFDYFNAGYFHSHTWFTVKELKKLKEKLELKLAELDDDEDDVDCPFEETYNEEEQWSEYDEVKGVINALDDIIKNTKRMVKLHCQNIYCEQLPTSKDILLLISFDS